MKLDHIHVEGYKSFREIDLPLKNLNILIGANGSGKSNFISIFRMLNNMVKGNFRAYISKTGGAESYLHLGEKITNQINMNFKFGINGYNVVWQPTVTNDLTFFDEKSLFQGQGYDHPFEEDLRKIPGISSFETGLLKLPANYDVSKHVLSNLKTWVCYHFHDTSDSALIKKSGPINLNEYLIEDGRNLAAFLYTLNVTSPDEYTKIRNIIRLAVPFFDDFNLRPKKENPDQILLEWRQKGSDYPFLPYQLSDGTLRFMCLVTVLLQPDPPAAIIIDEPELGLHPAAINIVGGLIRSAISRPNPLQVILSTQSVEIVNQFEPEDIVVAERENQEATLKRLNVKELSEWLEDYTLGELWKKNVLGGTP